MVQDNDDAWLDAMAGMLDEKDRHKNISIVALRSAIQRHNQEHSASAEQMNEGLQKLKHRLRKEGLVPERTSLNRLYKNVLEKLKFLIAFVLGMIAMAIIPSQLATRGSEVNFLRSMFIDNDESVSSALTFYEENPSAFSSSIIQTAISEGLLASVSQSNDQIEIMIKGLKSKDGGQMATRSRLNLPFQIDGQIKVIVRKKQS